MDWYVDLSSPESAPALRREVAAYLRRHAAPDSDIDGAELVFSELVGNAFRHANAGGAWVSVDWSRSRPVVTVHDLGPGFTLDDPDSPSPTDESGRGLFLVSHLADRLEVEAKRAGGSRVTATLPVTRPPEPSYDPAPRTHSSLPSPDEAAPDGTFGLDSFLRALVVQLAQAVELQHGPGAAEAAVAQVGADVGGRMEEEYRRARGIVSSLSREQVADLYVRLKAAIGGDFYVIEANEREIVLGNRRCPFGDVVKRAPALCRMTSSVFGGIAARNAGGAAVRLEERIAVGDPECRVVVRLGADETDGPSDAHRYHARA